MEAPNPPQEGLKEKKTSEAFNDMLTNRMQVEEGGEFVKKNNVKRQEEYEKLISFQSKDGN